MNLELKPIIYSNGNGLTDLLDVKKQYIPYGPDSNVMNSLEVKDYVKQAFDLLMGVDSEVKESQKYFTKMCRDYNVPHFQIHGIAVIVLGEHFFELAYADINDKLPGSIDGFADRYEFHNERGNAYILEWDLPSVMQTIGHEIGHLMGESMSDAVVEEAKAYAFETAWGRVIKENNIAGLANTHIGELGYSSSAIHSKAINLLKERLDAGYEPLDLFYKIGELGRLPD